LRIGVVTDDGYFSASPALRRAVTEAGNALAAIGATVSEFQLPNIAEAMRLYFGIISADGILGLKRTLAQGRCDWRVRRLLLMGRLKRPFRKIVTAILRTVGQRRTSQLVGWTGGLSANDYWQFVDARNEYINRFVELLNSQQIDVLITPPHSLPAIRHGGAAHLTLAASYSFLPNLIGAPAGSLPITRIQAGEETDRLEANDIVERAARETEIGSTGLPVNVQVIGRHWREDSVLAVMRALESHFRTRIDYPGRAPFET
jgi:fatty acid amide hydrolase